MCARARERLMEIRNRIRDNLWVIVFLASARVLTACGDDSSGDGGGGSDSGTDVDPNSPVGVRRFIDSQIPGGVAKLQVPAMDKDIPVPPAPAAYPGRFDTTESKRYLGKLLFHDPVRTQRV